MPIEPPDPGFVGNILQHLHYFLAVFGIGGALLPKAARRRTVARKRG